MVGVVVDEPSSFLAHDPMSATIPTTKTSKKNLFFSYCLLAFRFSEKLNDGRKATINVDSSAGDVSAMIGRQEASDTGKLLCLTDAAHRQGFA